jgi:hypothetical protein
MSNGFFCREDCHDPDCAGCDIERIPLANLELGIETTKAWLATLEAELIRRGPSGKGRMGI